MGRRRGPRKAPEFIRVAHASGRDWGSGYMHQSVVVGSGSFDLEVAPGMQPPPQLQCEDCFLHDVSEYREGRFEHVGWLLRDANKKFWSVYDLGSERRNPQLSGPSHQRAALERLVRWNLEHSSFDENPVEALAIINPEDRNAFSRAMYYLLHKAEAASDYAREEPFKAVLFAAFGVSALYGVYRMIFYPFPLWGGSLELNGQRYHMTNTDRLWMGRMVVGEAGESGWDDPSTAASKRRAGAAVLWAVATRHMTKPAFRGWTLTQTMRAFSQPINPIWASPLGEGCLRSPSACTPSRLQRRFQITNAPWYSLPAGVRQLVDDFFRGQVANPVPGYNNFADSAAISSAARAQSTLTPTTVGGNTFVRDQGSTAGEVRVV